MSDSKKIASLIAKKHEILKEIKGLQKKCQHINRSLKSIKESEDSSTFIIRWMCDDCERIIGIPNDQELNKYLNGSR